jgi:hypothetical protein
MVALRLGRGVELEMVHPIAIATGAPPTQPLDQLARHRKTEHLIEAYIGAGQHALQGFGLRNRAWELSSKNPVRASG